MALVIKDRVKETTTTTGTGTYTLAGAVTGFETFTANLSNSDTTYYVCTDNTDFEVGLGTFTSSGTTLARTTILASSNSNNAVNWSSGTRSIFMTYPADKAVFKDASNNINGTFVGNITGDVTGNADTATTLETAREINGTSFNGSANITVTAAAGTLTGNTLNSTVTASSLTSLGTLASDLNVGGQDIINTGVSSADTHAGEYGSSSSPITFTVTVASKSGHPYQGDGSGLAYVINGVQAPALTLHGVDNVTSDSGYYYRFDQSDSSNGGHPLRFYLDADKSTAYNTGVTTNGTAGSSGAYTQIDVDEDTPNILYYQCSNHGYMGNYAIVLGSNKINHSESLISFPTATTTLVGTGTTDTLTNKTIDVDNNTVSNIEVDNFKASAIVLESEGIGSNDNDTSLPTSAAVKDYVDTQITAEDLDLTTDSGTIAIDLDSETLTVTGGTGIDTSASGNEVTIAGSNASTSSKGIASFSDTFFSVSSGAVSLDAAQTGITSVLNASLVIGRDADNDIDFSTDNQITFRANGADQIKLSDGALTPVTDNDVDLGASGTEFKDLYLDGTAHVDAISSGGGITFETGTSGIQFGVSENNDVTLVRCGNNATTFGFNIKYMGSRSGNNNSLSIFTDNQQGGVASLEALQILQDGLAIFNNDIQVGDDINFATDAARLLFGTHNDVILTHVHDTGLLLNSSMQLQFGDSGTYIHQSADGVLDLVSDTEIEINATTIDMNGNLDVSGSLTLGGTAITSTAAELNILDGVTATASELNIMDGITSTTAELNILDGVTATASELNIMDGVTATTAELNHSDGVTSNIQTQLDAKTTATAAADEATALAIALG